MQGISRVFLFIGLSVAALGQAAQAHPLNAFEPVDSIPYRLAYQGWITVDATVNGVSGNDFIVDSGATITLVFANLAARQSFEPVGGKEITVLGLSGVKQLPAYHLGDFTFGQTRLTDHVGVVLPDWGPPDTSPQGLIGLDLLRRYTVFVDARTRSIVLYDPTTTTAKLNERGWVRAALSARFIGDQVIPVYETIISVGNKKIPCVVDLGASGTIFNQPAYKQMISGIQVNRDGLRGAAYASRLNDVLGNSSRGASFRISQLNIGRAKWRNRVFVVYNAEVFKVFQADRRPYCLLGMDLLANRSFIFDFSNEHLYIGPELK